MPNKAQYSTQHLDQFWLVKPLNLPKCHASTNKNYGDCYPLAISVSIYIIFIYIYIYCFTVYEISYDPMYLHDKPITAPPLTASNPRDRGHPSAP